MKAYELLSSKEKWARGAYAYTAEGAVCNPKNTDAYAFCLVGALEKCYDVHDGGPMYGMGRSTAYLGILEKLKNKVGNIPNWNDARERTYEEVIAVLKELDI